MKKLLSILAVAFIMTACSSSGSTTSVSELTEEQKEALVAAQEFVKSQFAYDAEFKDAGTLVLPTEVDGRYKVLQRFNSEFHDGFNYVYRIWVQKFPSGWEYGNLGIEDAGAQSVYNSNGRMKELEKEYMTLKEDKTAGSVNYTIIKRNAPNYVRVYTQTRLTRDDILSIYNELKNTYDIVQYSTSSNPDDDDYMAIQSGYVFEHDINKITKLADY